MTTPLCECADPGCNECGGLCENAPSRRLYRIDMDDETGTAFCQACAADADDCGLFSDKPA